MYLLIFSLDSHFLDNQSISSPGEYFITCDLLCKLKAANLAVPVPIDDSNESKLSPFDAYWLKVKLLKELSNLPSMAFIHDQITAYLTIKLIQSHLFYKLDERYKIIEDVGKYPESGHYLALERAWEFIFKPILKILESLITSIPLIENGGTNVLISTEFVASLAQLLASPITEEFELVKNSIIFSIFNLNSSYTFEIMKSFVLILDQAESGLISLVKISGIINLYTDLMIKLRTRNIDPEILSGFISIFLTRIIPLHHHREFHWIADVYSEACLRYFMSYEVAPNQEIKRSPFDPIFPIVSPFRDSETVVGMRRALLEKALPSEDSFHNQLSLFNCLQLFCQYQFFSREFVIDIFNALINNFMNTPNTAVLFKIKTMLIFAQIAQIEDPISAHVLSELHTLKDAIVALSKQSPGEELICDEILQMIDSYSKHS